MMFQSKLCTCMRKSRAFTLLEVLIVLSLLAIFTAFIIPSFKNLYEKTQAKVANEQLMRAINFAKSEAIELGRTVSLRKKEEWNKGYTIETSDNILFAFQNKSTSALYWRAFPYYLDHLEFLANGFPNFQNGTFWLCPQNSANPVWAIMLSQSGRARTVYPDAQGQILDEKGEPLGC